MEVLSDPLLRCCWSVELAKDAVSTTHKVRYRMQHRPLPPSRTFQASPLQATQLIHPHRQPQQEQEQEQEQEHHHAATTTPPAATATATPPATTTATPTWRVPKMQSFEKPAVRNFRLLALACYHFSGCLLCRGVGAFLQGNHPWRSLKPLRRESLLFTLKVLRIAKKEEWWWVGLPTLDVGTGHLSPFGTQKVTYRKRWNEWDTRCAKLPATGGGLKTARRLTTGCIRLLKTRTKITKITKMLFLCHRNLMDNATLFLERS